MNMRQLEQFTDGLKVLKAKDSNKFKELKTIVNMANKGEINEAMQYLLEIKNKYLS